MTERLTPQPPQKTAVDSHPSGPRSPEQRKREALERLARDNDVWVATADATGEPCLVPLALWWDGEAVWLSTRDTNPTGRNLCASGRLRRCFGDSRHVVRVHVTARTPTREDLPAEVAASGWPGRADFHVVGREQGLPTADAASEGALLVSRLQ